MLESARYTIRERRRPPRYPGLQRALYELEGWVARALPRGELRRVEVEVLRRCDRRRDPVVSVSYRCRLQHHQLALRRGSG